MPYDPDFIPGDSVPMPCPSASLRQRLLGYGQAVEHLRFSLLFDIVRCQAVCTAHNLDGNTLIPAGRIPRIDRFREDPQVPSILQIDNDRGYRNNDWDRGHLVMRRAMHWGDEAAARQADSESYYWTNISPQHSRLHATAWGSIEDWLLRSADEGNVRACIFCGPVLGENDPEHINGPDESPVRIPAGFWKIAVLRHQGRLSAAAFLVWQRDFDSSIPLPFDPGLEQVRVTTLEYLTSLDFGQLRFHDPLRFGQMPENSPGHRAARSAPTPLRPREVSAPSDIVL